MPANLKFIHQGKNPSRELSLSVESHYSDNFSFLVRDASSISSCRSRNEDERLSATACNPFRRHNRVCNPLKAAPRRNYIIQSARERVHKSLVGNKLHYRGSEAKHWSLPSLSLSPFKRNLDTYYASCVRLIFPVFLNRSFRVYFPREIYVKNELNESTRGIVTIIDEEIVTKKSNKYDKIIFLVEIICEKSEKKFMDVFLGNKCIRHHPSPRSRDRRRKMAARKSPIIQNGRKADRAHSLFVSPR